MATNLQSKEPGFYTLKITGEGDYIKFQVIEYKADGTAMSGPWVGYDLQGSMEIHRMLGKAITMLKKMKSN
jgi:hypothetical protein